MINKFASGSSELTDFLIKNPKRHIWINGSETVVFTGADIPETPKENISVSPRQFRQALTRAGLRAQVEALIGAADQNINDWYEYSTSFDSTHPVLLQMAGQLGKTEEDVRGLFLLASGL